MNQCQWVGAGGQGPGAGLLAILGVDYTIATHIRSVISKQNYRPPTPDPRPPLEEAYLDAQVLSGILAEVIQKLYHFGRHLIDIIIELLIV